MDIKSILVIFGCMWATIFFAFASWHLFKWLFTAGLLIGTVKRIAKLFVVCVLLLLCSGIYTYIVCYAKAHDLLPTVIESLKKEHATLAKNI
jgi:hypothetical protein